MNNPLNEQELHNLAMNIVGKDLEEQGYEFLAVNSTLKKDPQFVALKKGKLHFILVKAIIYPDNPNLFDPTFFKTMKQHALKFKARTFYAAVGLANAINYELPVIDNMDYIVNYSGIKEV